MVAYATAEELTARLSPAYDPPTPEEAAILLQKASEVIDQATLGRADGFWTDDPDDDEGWRTALSQATCDQVEFWLEVGEEHDVHGLTGSIVSGRLQIHPVASRLSTRARRTLQLAGLAWRGVALR